MARQHDLETCQMRQAVPAREDFHLTGESMAFNGGMQNQDSHLRLFQYPFRINNLHLIEWITPRRHMRMIAQTGESYLYPGDLQQNRLNLVGRAKKMHAFELSIQTLWREPALFRFLAWRIMIATHTKGMNTCCL